MRWARSWAAALAAAVVVMGGHYPSPPMSDLVLSEDHGPVRHVVLNRPEKRNAFHGELVLATGAALRAAADDPAVRWWCCAAPGRSSRRAWTSGRSAR